MTTKLLIYDDECAYCRGFAHLLRTLDRQQRFMLLSFTSAQAQELLCAQFGQNSGFAMFLFEDEYVSWGSEAAKRIVEALALPGSSVALWIYPKIVWFISWLTGRERRVCGPECAGERKTMQTQSLPLKAELKSLLERL